ncbi:hypothetical protein CPB84DRAFT_1677756 [Gymnopilus junonius]|uniref:Uncharacterized protein n=1 Tax=Gymnopilus junonius TaxID=109634 RepID=A0A9P5NTA9_GYMJU|nr:hypothetical protein CPB84DRAFT_1677756 [Gymnopilus junonius]
MRSAWQSFLLLGLFCVNTALGFPSQAFFESDDPAVENSTNNSAQWDLNAGPPINSTSNFIFSTVSSFLQHWPNTRYRNGHNIVPGIVPVGTLLYHGTFRKEIPNTPEWTATDPEHSYTFCRSLQSDSGCWHLTLVATRPLKVLYFDGSSAAKMNDGPMDSQDLVVWKEVKPQWAFREGERIVRLCDWGKKYEIDGFVRMEMDFEIMLCDFQAGVKTLSFLNIVPSAPSRRRPDEGRLLPDSGAPHPTSRISMAKVSTVRDYPEPPTDGPKGPFSLNQINFRIMEAGSWHNHFPGDPRFRLDYSRIISFYDPVLFPSLHAARLGQKRLDHRLEKISPFDVQTLFSQFEVVLKDWQGIPSGSGVDWQNIIRVVTNRYAERLELLHYILSSASIANAPLKQAYRHIQSMITPYILHSAIPPSSAENLTNRADHAWASPVYELCATTHTDHIENSELAFNLTHSERFLLGAVKNVTQEICRVVVGLWAKGTEAGLAEPDPTMFDGTKETSIKHDIAEEQLIKDWRAKVEGLMAWLDWSYWLRCRPACTYEEMCYLPTWPWFYKRQPRSIFLRNWLWRTEGQAGVETDDDEYVTTDPEEREWDDPQPRCVRRLEPFNEL